METNPPVALRPLNVGELTDGVFRLYRANFFVLIGIAAITQVPVGLVQIFILVLDDNGMMSAGVSTPLICIESLASILLLFLTQAALMVAAARLYLGKTVTPTQAYKGGWRRLIPLIVAAFVAGIAIGVPAGALAIVGSVVPGGRLLLLILIPYAAYLWTRWSVYAPGVLIEELEGWEALSRSWSLTDGYFWRALGVLVLNGILVYLISGLPQLIVQYGGIQVPSSYYSLVKPFAQTISILGTTLTMPIGIIVTVLLYYDLRVRKEGYDLQLLAEQTAAQQAGEADELPVPSEKE